MAKEIINEIREVEKQAKEMLDKAYIDAANIVDKAKSDAAIFYDDKINETIGKCEEKILAARTEAEKKLSDAEAEINSFKESIKKNALGKKEEAAKEIIKSLV